MKKQIYHYEQAAIGGHPHARNLLAGYEGENGRLQRKSKHLIIAAKLGSEMSLSHIKQTEKFRQREL